MIKFSKGLAVLGLVGLTVVGVNFFNGGDVVQAASVGSQLTQPESGWTRYNDSDANISYDSNYQAITRSDYLSYNNDYHVNGNNSEQRASIKFGFTGTKLRIISWKWFDCSGASVKIDGVDYGAYSDYSSSAGGNNVFFEALNLSDTAHQVVITSAAKSVIAPASSMDLFALDAIDIDSAGKLLPYNAAVQTTVNASGISLNKTTDNMYVGQSDNLTATVTPSNTSNKKLTWTSSDPSVASVDSNGKVTGLKEGTAIITAKTTDGTNLSASCNVTVYKSLIEDANLRQVILTSLNKPANYILTEADLNTVTWLDASNKNIASLKGMEYCKNLDALNVEKNNITDLSPLESITKLHWLNAANNKISDITPLKTMTGLDVINLPDNKISDLTPLKGNKNLKALYVFRNNITDISALADCTGLEELSLAFNNVQDISALENLTKLKKLYLHFTNISDISVLANFTELDQLNLGWNNITDVTALEKLTKLDTLWVNNNKIKDLTPVKDLNVPTLVAQDQQLD